MLGRPSVVAKIRCFISYILLFSRLFSRLNHFLRMTKHDRHLGQASTFWIDLIRTLYPNVFIILLHSLTMLSPKMNNPSTKKNGQKTIEKSFHSLSEKELYTSLNSSADGLSAHNAEELLHKHGLNEITAERKISPFTIFIKQFYSPLVWILLGALIISVILEEFVDAAVIGIIVILNAILGLVQEYRAEKAIEALRKLTSLQATVWRDGKEIRIDSKYLVPGDLILLETGNKIPADARLSEVHSFETQEASLTGESQPIAKITWPLPEKTALADRKNMIYASTIVTNGRAKAIVISTGMQSEVGKIAALITEAETKLTPLQKKIKELGKYLTIAVILVTIITFLSGIATGKSISLMLLTAIALAVAAIPEGLPAVITISLALGVQRMIKGNALIRTLPSVETLGSVNVICTDKTGTLTHNEMTVTKIFNSNTIYDVEGTGYAPEGNFLVHGKKVDSTPLEQLLTIGALCNDAKLERSKGQWEIIGDPTEAALLVSAEKMGLPWKQLLKTMPRIDEIAFTSERKMMTTIYQFKTKKMSYTKGAPDIIINLCNRILINGVVHRLDRAQKNNIIKQNEAFANEALRVLGFAYNDVANDNKNAEKGMIFVGLQAMIDPPREEVKDAIKRCHEAGIRVMMITGDHLITAKAIAHKLGIPGEAITGDDIDNGNLEEDIKHIGIFARVNPEHKLDIIQALKKNGYIVAMTGDGVNDAPALKKADIGIAMGKSGTDVAKEASDMILLDDNFTSIVHAIEEGRGIFDNIRKFVKYLLSSNLGEILVILLATLLALPLPLTPIHLLWINLITDGLPAIALSVDPAEKGTMKKPPRKPKESIITKTISIEIASLGLMIGAATLILFLVYLRSPEAKARTIAFTALVVFEIVRLQMIRSEYRLSLFSNKFLVCGVGASLLLQILVLYVPFLNIVFETVPLGLTDWLWIIVAAMFMFVLGTMFNALKKRLQKSAEQ